MKRALLAVFLLTVIWAPAAEATFVDVTVETGIVIEHLLDPDMCNPPISAGSAWGDYDGDGDLDVFVTNHGGPNHLFRNDGDSPGDGDQVPEFSDQAPALGVDDPDDVSLGAVFVDYDNDGDQDLMVLNWNGNRLYRNGLIGGGGLGFTDVAPALGLVDSGRPITAAWGDYNQDGWLDVYIAKHGECNDTFGNNHDRLFRSNGGASFTDVTADALCDANDVVNCFSLAEGLGFSPGWLDYDDDGDLDLYVVNDNIADVHSPNVLWRNDGLETDGAFRFTDVSAETGTDVSLNGMGLAIADADNDQDLDLTFSNIGPNVMLRDVGDSFQDISAAAGIERPLTPGGEEAITWATVMFDYDNDADNDLFIAAGYIASPPFVQPNAFFRSDGQGRFEDVADEVGLDHPGRGRGASVADFDDDGDIDLVVTNYGEPPLIYENDDLSNRRWMKFRLEGTASNRDAIGSLVYLELPDGTRMVRMVSSGPTHGGGDSRELHFGLDNHQQADVRVRWPDLQMRSLGDFDADVTHHLVQPQFLTGAPVPGVRGQTNTIEVTGATPGATIYLVRGSRVGHIEVPPCPGTYLAIGDPRTFGIEAADGNGTAVFEGFVGGGGNKDIGYFQAVDSSNCAAGSLRIVDWTP